MPPMNSAGKIRLIPDDSRHKLSQPFRNQPPRCTMYSVPPSSILSSLALLVVVLAGCDKPDPQVAPTPPPSSHAETPAFPITRTLSDSSGRPLEGQIVAKSDSNLFVIRSVDRLHFQIPIKSLSPADQKFAESLPERLPPPNFSPANISSPSPSTPTSGKDSPYVAQRRKLVDDLKAEISQLSDDLVSMTPNGIKYRSTVSEIERKNQEITELTEDINRYLEDNP